MPIKIGDDSCSSVCLAVIAPPCQPGNLFILVPPHYQATNGHLLLIIRPTQTRCGGIDKNGIVWGCLKGCKVTSYTGDIPLDELRILRAGAIIQIKPSQSANIIEFRTSSGTVTTGIDHNGHPFGDLNEMNFTIVYLPPEPPHVVLVRV